SSRSNAWAVESDVDRVSRGTRGRRAQALHWSGSGWRVVPTPPIDYLFLQSVADVTKADAWAVGYAIHGWIEHWNGARWRAMPGAKVDGSYHFWDTAFLSRTDGWVVGNRPVDTSGSDSAPLAEHWNGSTWKVTPTPGRGYDDVLRGVSARAPDDVWAVGSTHPGTGALLR